MPISGSMSDETINGWKIGGLIKSASLGDIYEATPVKNQLTTNAMAKIVTPQYKTHVTMIENEIGILNKINDQHVIKLLSYDTKVLADHASYINERLSQAMLVYENMTNGDLDQYLKWNKKFDLKVSQNIFYQIVDVLYFLHNKLHIAHRNVQASNISFDNHFNIKITDFSLSQMCDKEQKIVKPNALYKYHGIVAPEMIFYKQSVMETANEKEQLACDIFGLGIILWKMLFGINSQPFEKFDLKKEKMIYYLRYKVIYDKKYDLWWKNFENDVPCYNDIDLKNLFIQMFDPFPKSRITISDIKRQEWYKEIDHAYSGMKGKYNQEYFVDQMQRMRVYNYIFMNTTSESM